MRPSPQKRPVLKVRTTTLVVGTTDLAESMREVQALLPEGQLLPNLMLGSVLFDLLMRTNAMELSAQELSQHLEAEMEERLGWRDGGFWYRTPVQQLLTDLYDIFRNVVWPELANNPTRKATAVLQQLDSIKMELSMMRPEGW